MKPCVLFISGREVGYIRNRVLLQALRAHFDVLVHTTDTPGTVGRIATGIASLAIRRPDYDVCFAGFYGQPLAIALSLLQRKPIVLDAYVSTYDTLCEDRRWFSPRSPAGRLAYWLDRRSCVGARRVVTDTLAHARYFQETFHLPQDKFAPIYVGCDEALFYPRGQTHRDSSRIEVFYYGSYLPLHGTDVIVQAAALLRSRPDIHFTLGGTGARRTAIQHQISEMGLANVDLKDWIPFDQLPDYIARASICLGGHFSTVTKATRVISTKTFQFIAMQKPTIVGDNLATREVFAHGEHVYMVPMGSPAALAEVIQDLADDPALRRRLASGGHDVFQRRFSVRAIADSLMPVVESLIDVPVG
jgi:glycosyltransferase involved in cell wall biosynthesis